MLLNTPQCTGRPLITKHSQLQMSPVPKLRNPGTLGYLKRCVYGWGTGDCNFVPTEMFMAVLFMVLKKNLNNLSVQQ